MDLHNSSMPTRLSRVQVPVESTWNLNDLFVNESAWESEYQTVDEARVALSVYQGQLSGGAAKLVACLNAVESVQARLMRVNAFPSEALGDDATRPERSEARLRK